MLQLHLSGQRFYCILMCDLYKRFDGICITIHVASHVGHKIPNHHKLDNLFHILFQLTKNGSTKAPYCWAFVKGIRIPSQRVSNVENYLVLYLHHAVVVLRACHKIGNAEWTHFIRLESWSVILLCEFNTNHANFSEWINIKMHLYFIHFFKTWTVQVFEILPQRKKIRTALLRE